MQTTTVRTEEQVDFQHLFAYLMPSRPYANTPALWRIAPIGNEGEVVDVDLVRDRPNEPWHFGPVQVQASLAQRHVDRMQISTGEQMLQQGMDELERWRRLAQNPPATFRAGAFSDGGSFLVAPVYNELTGPYAVATFAPEVRLAIIAANLAMTNAVLCREEERIRLRRIEDAHRQLLRAGDLASEAVRDTQPAWANIHPSQVVAMPDWWTGLARSTPHMTLREALGTSGYAEKAARTAAATLPRDKVQVLNGCLNFAF